MQLVVVTALAGILLAPHPVNFVIGLCSLICIAVGAGASGALNMWYDSDIDAVMRRTAKRPIPTGRVTRPEVLAFGIVLSGFAVLTLYLVANALAAALLAFTIFFYIVIYTMWLKRTTPQNIVIGGAAGALPPIVGYAAATGQVDVAPLVLFGLIFAWTPPHFWALALARTTDYGKAGVPMMPNVKGADHTRLQILLYSVILVAIGVLPTALGFASYVYGAFAAALGLDFCAARFASSACARGRRRTRRRWVSSGFPSSISRAFRRIAGRARPLRYRGPPVMAMRLIRKV